MTQNRRGFTLLEMLIAMTVLVILAGVTIFSTLDMLTTADAQKVINDMMQMKTATLMWYRENSSRVVLNSSGNYEIKTNGKSQPFKEFIRDHNSEILYYMSDKNKIVLRNKESSTNNTGDFTLIDIDYVKWYLCYNLGVANLLEKGEEAPDAKVREKIAGQAKKFNLLGLNDIKKTPQTKYTANDRYACMLVLELKK